MVDEVERDASGIAESNQNTAAQTQAEAFRNKLDLIKKIIMKWVQKRLSGSRERPAEAEKSQVANEIKNAILQQSNNVVWLNQLHPQLRLQHEGAIAAVQTIADIVTAYHEAYKEGFFDPIPDAPTNAFHDGLMSYIDQFGVSPGNAIHIQTFIRGMFEQPQYVRFSPPGSPDVTPFERNLYSTLKSDPATARAVIGVMNQKAANGELGDITPELINTKVTGFNELLKQAIEQHEKVEEDQWEKSDKNRIKRLLSSGETQDDKEAYELYNSMESVDGFHTYYVKQFNQEMQNPDVLAISNERKRKERAAKNVTNKFQRLLLFTTHRIYEPVLGGDARKPFQQLVQDASGAFNANPNTFFTTLNNQLVRLWSGIKTRSEYDTDEVPYFQYGNERKEVYQHDESKVGEKHTYKQGKVVLQDTVSNELKEVNFKDFVQHLFTAIEAEKSLLEAGINSNHLILTGKIGQNSTFFTQFAGYAQDSLQANRIDELYKLPYSEIVEAAKIQLSSYYKMRYALNNWKKEPHILMDLFDNVNEVEKNALGDMIDSYKKDNIPEWVIKRAIVHARMHLGLINTELHAISSYAHAPVSDFGKATYRDPSLKNLDTFRSWYAAEQWQVPDTHVQSMAYMPSAKGAWMYKDWDWKDVTDEGKEIVERSLQFGDMARVDRKYFNQDIAPNLLELNPMGFGGVEIQGGWRLKYPAISWVNDMIDHLGTEEHLKIKDEHTLTNGWKRFENIGVNILKMYKDNYLFGQDNALLKLDEANGTVKGEKQLENFFKFMYRRYFSKGVGHDGFSYTYKDNEYKDVSINYAELKNEDEFWNKLVKPILVRKNVTGLTETPKDAEARNQRERAGALHGIVEQALAITTYERLPMDFVSMENPSRSQNGVTLLSELQNEFIKSNAGTNPTENHTEFKTLNGAFNDLLFVQQQARIRSIKQMSKFVERQSDNDIDQKNVFCENLADINASDYSDIQLAEGVDQKGYVITVDTVRAILNEKYDLTSPGLDNLPPEKIEENKAKVEKAVNVYESIQKKVVLKPAIHREELDPQHSITETRINLAMKNDGLDPTDHDAKEAFRAKYADRLKEKYKEYRNTVMTTRLAWSQHELLSGETALPINDTAYQFLDHTRAGQDMVSRSLTAIANTQERYKNDIMGGEMNSALKKIYRKEDMESWQKIIVELRNSIKQEDGDKANDMALKVAMNVNNVMRINSDAENPFVEADYIARHLPRCAIANVVKEGPEYPWRRQDRFRNIGELLHNAQFAKRAKPENQVFTPMESRAEAMRYWMGKWGTLGEMVGGAIDKFYGKPTGLLVRERWKELSGEGLRERMVASLGDVFQYEWQGVVTLVLIGLLILSIKEAYTEVNN